MRIDKTEDGFLCLVMESYEDGIELADAIAQHNRDRERYEEDLFFGEMFYNLLRSVVIAKHKIQIVMDANKQ